MLITVVDVVERRLGGGLEGAVEMSGVGLAIVAALGVAYAQQQGTHIRTDIVTSRLPARVGMAVEALGMVAMAGFAAWMIVATGQRAVASVVSGEYILGLIEVPVWPARVAITLGCALLLGETVVIIVRLLSGLCSRPGEPAAGPAPE